MIDINDDMRRLYEESCTRHGKRQSVEGWQLFKMGWGEALLYAAQARYQEQQELDRLPSGCDVCAGVRVLDGRPMYCESCGAQIKYAEPWTDPEPWIDYVSRDRRSERPTGPNAGHYAKDPRTREQYDAETSRKCESSDPEGENHVG